YTSGKIISRYKQDFLYGRIEARMKVPTGGGMWPAFWMMPTDEVYGGWAASGEIDIMETANNTDYIGGTIHYGGNWPYNQYSPGTYSPGGVNFSDAFHVYTIEWEPDVMRWYVDGNLYSTKTSSIWYSDSDPGNPRAPFDKEFYIIINAAVGGNYTGCTSSGCITASLPQQYLVDWVRVYQESPNNAPTVSITNPTNGAILPAGNITIDATASDSDGSVATVEFYEGANLLGEDTTSPYSYTWNSVTDGCYTIMAKAIDDLGGYSTDSIDIEVGAGCPQTPYGGSPAAIPGQIEAEDYDIGGEDSAYHDADAGNTGGQYRSDDVDIEICTEGGHNVGYISADEWLEYTVDVTTAGDYTIEARVASNSTGGGFHIEFDGVDKTGPMTVPVTGGWQNWTTINTTVNLSAGVQIMRFVKDSVSSEEYNLNYFNLTALAAADGFANADIDVAGTRAGSYSDTRDSDDVYEELTEEESGGKQSDRHSFLEHKWTLGVAPGDTVTFYVEAYHTSNTEGDDFVFAYSTDDSTYIDMLTVSKTSDDDQVQSYVLPSSLSGTVYIRVMDTDQSTGNKVLDTLFVDEMYIDSGSSTVTVPDVLGMDQVSAQSAITAAGLSVGVIGQSFDNAVAAGDTKSQTPSGGTLVSSGSAVDLEISLGICGDLDISGTVDIADVEIMAGEWLTAGTVADIEPIGGDNWVDFRDFAVLASNWGQSIQEP
ncbi:MAG: carbohydrate-binding protein, partial [Planctomycetota bacterium]